MTHTAVQFDFRSAIEKAIAKFEKAANEKDVAAMVSHYAPDATLLPPGSAMIKGHENIRAFWQRFLDAGASDASLRVVDVEVSGNTAYEIGTFQAMLPNAAGGIAPAEGKYVVIWRRETDDTINMVADIFNLNQ